MIIVPDQLQIGPSFDPRDDLTAVVLLTHGVGEEHFHTVLNRSQATKLRDWLNIWLENGA